MKQKDTWFYVISILSGVLVWVVVSAVSGKKEAWDSSRYGVGYAFICVMSITLGYLRPVQTWRWGVMPFLGQFVWMLVNQGAGNLMPLGIIVFGVMALPAVISAKVGAYIGLKEAGRSDLEV